MKMEVKIRRATKKDLPELAELWKKFVKYHVKLSPFYTKKVKDAPKKWIKHVKSKKLGKKNAVMFVAVKNKKIIGYATGNVKKDVPVYKLRKYGLLGSIFVLSDYRGKGIGTLFKKKVFEWFKSKKLKYAEIEVLTANKKTKKIYKRWGFKDYITKMRRRL